MTATGAKPVTERRRTGDIFASPRRILAVAGRIVRQFLHDRRSLALLFVAPLLVMTVLNLVLNNSTASVTLGIVPPDGPLGAAIVEQLKARTHDQSGFTVKTLAADQVDAALKNGNADGVLIFPADFLTEIEAGQTPQLTLRLEGSNPAAAKQLRGLTSLLVASLAQGFVAAPIGAGTPSGVPIQPPAPTLATTYLYGGPEYTQTDAMAPLFIGLFALFFIFLLTSVSSCASARREPSSG